VADGVAVSTLTATIRDALGNPVPDIEVAFATNGGGNTLAPRLATTDAGGTATATLASTVAETKTITVTAAPSGSAVVLADQPQVEFVGDPSNLSASLSDVSASPALGVVADGTTVSTIQVTARDVNGNVVAGRTVLLAASGGGNTLVQPLGTTGADGTASGTLASIVAETKTITVTLDPGVADVVLASAPTVEFVGDPSSIDAVLSSCSAAPTTGVVADGLQVSTLTVVVRDVNSNPVAGRTVEFAVSGSANTLTQPVATTDSSGVASGTIASTAAETKMVTATIDPGASQVVLAEQPTVEFIADASNLSATLSTAVAAPASGVVANGVATSTITVVVRDANGNAVPAIAVQFDASGSANTLVPNAAATDAAGEIRATLASTLAETKTVTITLDPGPAQVVLASQPSIEFIGDAGAIDPVLSSVSASPSAGVVAD
jgi:adhesin/invasin